MSKNNQISSHHARGHFITIEGGDGSGKTTLLNQIEELLKTWGFSTLRTREPGGTELGEHIRSWVLSHRLSVQMDAKAELLLFLAARAQHLDQVIIPALQAGKIVLCDRFNDSTIAYQGEGRQLGTKWVQDLCLQICKDTLPELTFYLDVDPERGLERAKGVHKVEASAEKRDRFESEELPFHYRIQKAFLEIARAEPNRFHRIDANLSQVQVREAAFAILAQHFGMHPIHKAT